MPDSTRVWSSAVKDRDAHRCQVGMCTEAGSEAHHVYPQAKYRHLSKVLDNGLTLCQTHHRKFHADYNRWLSWWSKKWPNRARSLRAMISDHYSNLLEPRTEVVSLDRQAEG